MRSFTLVSILACMATGIAALPAPSVVAAPSAAISPASLGSALPSPPAMPSGMPNGTLPCGPPPIGNLTMGMNSTLPLINGTMPNGTLPMINGTMPNGTLPSLNGTGVCGPDGPGGNETLEGGRGPGGPSRMNGTSMALPSGAPSAVISAPAVPSASASA